MELRVSACRFPDISRAGAHTVVVCGTPQGRWGLGFHATATGYNSCRRIWFGVLKRAPPSFVEQRSACTGHGPVERDGFVQKDDECAIWGAQGR